MLCSRMMFDQLLSKFWSLTGHKNIAKLEDQSPQTTNPDKEDENKTTVVVAP